VQLETRGGNLKKALASANRQGVQTALILGDGELERGIVAAKHLATGVQEEWSWTELEARLGP
jgi:histidyl-tRNA synthetase